MIEFKTIYVEAQRLDSGEWELWGTDASGTPVTIHELRVRLFAWHERSLYGSLLQLGDLKEHTLRMSPMEALDYFSEPGVTLHLPVEWSDELQLLIQAASLLQESMTKGWYMPDAESWQRGKPGWRLLLPEVYSDAYERMGVEIAEASGVRLDDWFSEALQELIATEPAIAEAWEELLREQPMLQLDEDELVQVLDPAFALTDEEWLIAAGWKQDEIPFRTCFQLLEPDEVDTEAWRFRIVLQDKLNPSFQVDAGPSLEDVLAEWIPASWVESAPKKIPMELERVARLLPEMKAYAGDGEAIRGRLDDEEAWDFLTEGSLRLLQAGYSVLLPSWWEELRRMKPRLKAKLGSSVGSSRSSMFGADQILQFDWKVALGGIEFSEEEFARLTAEKKRLIYVRGRWIQLDPAVMKQIQLEMRRVEKTGLTFRDMMELHLLGVDSNEGSGEPNADHDLESMLRMEVELNRHVAELFRQLQHTEKIPIVEPSPRLQADLRGYQKEGVSWLLFMRRFGLGACLADDMGLGKTVQFIAYLLAASEKYTAPSLLICPTSVLGNWQKELERFAPSLKVYLHYGPQRAKEGALSEAVKGCDLVVTSYTLAQIDEQELAAVPWQTIGLDEAQNIKNAHTKQSLAIRRLGAQHRIALTGTPIENRLTELWSIFDFMNPGYLGSLAEFTHKFVNPIEKQNDAALVHQVQRLIRPFLLRRVKKDPAIQLALPEKQENKAYVALSVEQATLYENVVEALMNRIDAVTGMEKKGLILATLTKLKQICDHPSLFLKEQDGSNLTEEERSPKVTRLLEMIDELRAEGDKCLIFTQYVEMGTLLQRILQHQRGGTVPFLHGGVPKAKRDEMIARFQDPAVGRSGGIDDASGIFILSLKAGGTGLNLTEANHVFHFDRWWNPAVENQATDRAFRIGQTRNVQVHKFITLGTLEERIDEMIEKKSGLSNQIVGTGENWVTEMSTGELRELFALRREWIRK